MRRVRCKWLPDATVKCAWVTRPRHHLNERLRADGRSLCRCCVLSERKRGNGQYSETKRCPPNVVQKRRVPRKISLPTYWRAPDPPVRRTNQNRLIGPSIVPPPQFSTAWKTQWHNASLLSSSPTSKTQSSGASWIGSHRRARHDIPESLKSACD